MKKMRQQGANSFHNNYGRGPLLDFDYKLDSLSEKGEVEISFYCDQPLNMTYIERNFDNMFTLTRLYGQKKQVLR